MATARCETCGNEYDKPIEVVIAGQPHTFDSLECALLRALGRGAQLRARSIMLST